MAEAMVLSLAMRNRLDGLNPIYDNRQHKKVFYNRSPRFFQEHYEEVEERVHKSPASNNMQLATAVQYYCVLIRRPCFRLLDLS